MTNREEEIYHYEEKIYYYDGEYYKGMNALVKELVDRGFCGDMEDLEYIMVYVDFVFDDEAEEICSRLRDICGENDEAEEEYVSDDNEEE